MEGGLFGLGDSEDLDVKEQSISLRGGPLWCLTAWPEGRRVSESGAESPGSTAKGPGQHYA